MKRRDMVLAAIVASFWGFNFVVIDWGMTGVPPLLFVAIRFLVVALAVFVVPRPRTSWRTVIGVGLFMSLGQFGLLYTSMALGLQPGLAALVLQAQAVFTILIAAAVLRERPTVPQIAGIGLGIVGLAIVAAGRGGDAPALAVALALAAAFSWGIGNVISRRAGVVSGPGRLGSLSLTVWSALVVPVPALMLSFVVEGPEAISSGIAAFGWQSLLSTLYTAVLCTIIGYSIWNGLLARNPSAAVVPWVLLAPVVAMASAALLLGQIPTPAEIIGGTLLVGGVLVTGLRRRVSFRRRGITEVGRQPMRSASAGDDARPIAQEAGESRRLGSVR
ncbi:O-acetylserine/cysteine efflux transporter [Microbacterium trichothecenolyticum]|uniref:EamA family transporter n=1 Tax=Microbacterium trichothecenolyticum TaxID=69370 RepID=UPI002861FF24|nr:EamA family transporter [Microbacterium trichothecenolyticum]MDR7110462.1 O-acetylserine/cysteine efflux transporter [Microbacterium trichothecenolyticum]